jgi:hypothetical protein
VSYDVLVEASACLFGDGGVGDGVRATEQTDDAEGSFAGATAIDA